MIKVLSRYDQSQLNIKLPTKEYRILASQNNKVTLEEMLIKTEVEYWMKWVGEGNRWKKIAPSHPYEYQMCTPNESVNGSKNTWRSLFNQILKFSILLMVTSVTNYFSYEFVCSNLSENINLQSEAFICFN